MNLYLSLEIEKRTDKLSKHQKLRIENWVKLFY
jgi:hypothetical protein